MLHSVFTKCSLTCLLLIGGILRILEKAPGLIHLGAFRPETRTFATSSLCSYSTLVRRESTFNHSTQGLFLFYLRVNPLAIDENQIHSSPMASHTERRDELSARRHVRETQELQKRPRVSIWPQLKFQRPVTRRGKATQCCSAPSVFSEQKKRQRKIAYLVLWQLYIKATACVICKIERLACLFWSFDDC